MEVLARFGRVALAAGTVALLSMEAVHLESPKAESASEDRKRAVEAALEQKEKKAEEAKAVARRSTAPRMAPQFDGLNFYETFIGAAQR